MENQKITDIWFFVGHSIGVTLLGIYTLEAAFMGLPANERGNLYLVINGDKRGLYEDLLQEYPYITLVSVSALSFNTLLRIWLSTLGHKQIVLHPMSFGVVHVIHAWLTWLIVLLHRRSQSVIFGERTFRNRFFFTTILPRNLTQSIFTSQTDAVATTGIVPVVTIPILKFSNQKSPTQLEGRQYIVIHPFAASRSRSLPPARWQDLIDWLHATYSNYCVVISGGPADSEAARAFSRPYYSDVYFSEDIVTSFLAKISLIAQAALYIGVDTGPTHIAAHVGVPTVLVGNNSNPCWLPDYNPAVTILMNLTTCTCQGDKTGDCFELEDGVKYYRCLFSLTQEEIKTAISHKLIQYDHSK